MGFFSQAFLVCLIKGSTKRRRKQPGKVMAKSFTAGQFARCPALNEPPGNAISTGLDGLLTLLSDHTVYVPTLTSVRYCVC